MRTLFIAAASLLAASAPAFAQPDQATTITDAQVQEILKKSAPAIDHPIQTVDMGKYQVNVGITYRSPTGPQSGAALANAKTKPCGLKTKPAGAKEGPNAIIYHSDAGELYVITGGSGTSLTGGKVFNGKLWPTESDLFKFNYGPSCSGQVVGDFTTQKVKAGDVVVIPPGVPHGWTELSPDVTYFSIRIDPKNWLQRDYVNPIIK